MSCTQLFDTVDITYTKLQIVKKEPLSTNMVMAEL